MATRRGNGPQHQQRRATAAQQHRRATDRASKSTGSSTKGGRRPLGRNGGNNATAGNSSAYDSPIGKKTPPESTKKGKDGTVTLPRGSVSATTRKKPRSRRSNGVGNDVREKENQYYQTSSGTKVRRQTKERTTKPGDDAINHRSAKKPRQTTKTASPQNDVSYEDHRYDDYHDDNWQTTGSNRRDAGRREDPSIDDGGGGTANSSMEYSSDTSSSEGPSQKSSKSSEYHRSQAGEGGGGDDRRLSQDSVPETPGRALNLYSPSWFPRDSTASKAATGLPSHSHRPEAEEEDEDDSFESAGRRTTRAAGSTGNGGEDLLPRLLEKARNSLVDDENVMDALMNSGSKKKARRRRRSNEDDEDVAEPRHSRQCSSSSGGVIGSTLKIVDRDEVSADESELGMLDPVDSARVAARGGGGGVSKRAGGDRTTNGGRTKTLIDSARVEDQATAKGKARAPVGRRASVPQQQHGSSSQRTKDDRNRSTRLQNREKDDGQMHVQQPNHEDDDSQNLSLSLPPLPPEWIVKYSRSKNNRPYYCHHAYGAFWDHPLHPTMGVLAKERARAAEAGQEREQFEDENEAESDDNGTGVDDEEAHQVVEEDERNNNDYSTTLSSEPVEVSTTSRDSSQKGRSEVQQHDDQEDDDGEMMHNVGDDYEDYRSTSSVEDDDGNQQGFQTLEDDEVGVEAEGRGGVGEDTLRTTTKSGRLRSQNTATAKEKTRISTGKVLMSARHPICSLQNLDSLIPLPVPPRTKRARQKLKKTAVGRKRKKRISTVTSASSKRRSGYGSRQTGLRGLALV